MSALYWQPMYETQSPARILELRILVTWLSVLCRLLRLRTYYIITHNRSQSCKFLSRQDRSPRPAWCLESRIPVKNRHAIFRSAYKVKTGQKYYLHFVLLEAWPIQDFITNGLQTLVMDQHQLVRSKATCSFNTCTTIYISQNLNDPLFLCMIPVYWVTFYFLYKNGANWC